VTAVPLMRELLQNARWLLDETIKDVTPDQAQWTPPGVANPLGATLAHIVLTEDFIINNLLKGGAPLAAGEWAGKAGVSEPPPPSMDWASWGRNVKVDLNALRTYAKAVNAATDSYLANLPDEALQSKVDLSGFGLGEQTVAWVLDNAVVGHLREHCGEISCLKGVQGAKGYPI